MYVNAFDGDANLARVEKGAKGYFRCDLGNIDVWEDNTGVVTSELERIVRRR